MRRAADVAQSVLVLGALLPEMHSMTALLRSIGLALLAGAIHAPAQSPAPLPSCQVDDRVEDLAVADGVVYAAGRFQRARPAGEVRGGPTEVSRSGVLAFDAVTGVLAPWAPLVQHAQFPIRVDCVVVSTDGETIWFGGVFDTVNGQRRVNVAAVDRAGQLTPWRASQLGVGRVRDLALSADGTQLYIAGDRGVQRFGTAASVQLADRRFAPSVVDAQGQPASVWALALSPNGRTLYLGSGGAMAAVNGAVRTGAAAVDARSGRILPFAPQLRDVNPIDPRVEIWEIRCRDGAVHLFGDWWQTFVGGVWTGDPVRQRNYGRFDPITGAADPSFVPWSDGGIQAGDVDTVGGRVFFGGQFDRAGGSENDPAAMPWRPDLAAVDLDGSDRAEAWAPKTLRNGGSGTSQLFAIEFAAGRLIIGGEFSRTGGADQDSLAMFAVADRRALFVVADPTALLPGDRAIASRLERELGFAVTLQDDDLGDGSEAIGMDLVVISNTAGWAAVQSRYRGAAAPIVTWNASLYGYLGLTRGWWNVDAGVEDALRIEPVAAHALAGRFSADSGPLYTKRVPIPWAQPVAAAQVVAVTPSGGLPCWFVLHGGDTLWDGTAAAGTRIAIPGRREFPGSSGTLFAPGFGTVFDASVRYAVGQAGAAVRRLTGGCSQGDQPQLRIDRLPRIGRSFEVAIVDGVPGAAAALVVDPSGTIPQPVVPGCALLVDTALGTTYPRVLNGVGGGSWSLPTGSALHQLYRPARIQVLVIDPGGPLFGTTSLSDGFEVVVQP